MKMHRFIKTILSLIATLALHYAASAADPDISPPPGKSLDADRGKTVYEEFCQSCHKAGKNKAPKLSRARDWKKAGFDSFSMMEKHARKGFLNMPTKGGNAQLADEDIADAVLYMKLNIGKK